VVSTNFSAVDLLDTDTGHTNGPRGHDAINAAIDIATRPASTRTITHTGTTLTIDADQLLGGHTARVTVSANITGLTMNNMTTGLPFLLILDGNGSSSFTANLSAIKINSTTSLDAAVAVGPTSRLAVCFIKTVDGVLWAPAGLLSYGTAGGGGSSITSIGFGSLPFTGASVTSVSVPLPAGIAAGDLIEVLLQTQESTDPGAPTTPGGYTQRFTNTPSAGFIPRLTKVYKIASGSEGGTNLTVTFPTSCRPCGGSQVWRGVNTSTPYDITSASAAQMGNGNPDPNSVTTLTANAVVVAYTAGNKTGGGTCTAPTTPGTYAKTLDQSGADRSAVIAYRTVTAAGAENPNAFAWTVDNHTVITDALKKA
jgi:hypothetical protein